MYCIFPVEPGGKLEPNNLITLCMECRLLAPDDPEKFWDYQKNFGARGQMDFFRLAVRFLKDDPSSSIESVLKEYLTLREFTFVSRVRLHTGDSTLWKEFFKEHCNMIVD